MKTKKILYVLIEPLHNEQNKIQSQILSKLQKV